MVYNNKTVPPGPIGQIPEEGLDEIHKKSLDIIENLGIQVLNEKGKSLLLENGGTVHDNDIVTLPRSLVENSIESVPEEFTLHARNPDNNVTVGGDDNIYAPIYGPANIRKYGKGRRASTLQDYENLLKLVQMEGPVNNTGYTICEPNDVDESVKHIEMVKRNLEFTDLSIMGSNYGADRAKASIEMAGIVNEDPDLSKPYIVGLANSPPPRRWDNKMIGGLLEYAKYGQPIIIAPVVMAGASGPATMAGAMALQNANILMGVVMTQLQNPGAPVLYGVPATNVDMRYGSFSAGTPEGGMFVTFAGQMGRYYGIPTRAGGGMTDSKTVDAQSGAESMLQLTVSMLSDIDFQLLAAGYLESANTVSMEKFVLDVDKIRYLNRYESGFEINEETFALDLIEEVDADGHFLNQSHTLKHSTEEFLIPEVFDRKSHDTWEDEGEKDAYTRAHERVEQLLEEYEKPPMPEDIQTELNQYASEAINEIENGQ